MLRKDANDAARPTMPLSTFPVVALAAVASAPALDRTWAYVFFLALVAGFLVLDLVVFHREAHEVRVREAVGWSVIWITCGLLFAVWVHFAYERHWFHLGLDTPQYSPKEVVAAGGGLITRGEVRGSAAAQQYLVGYVVEKSLSMDNIFVIALVFAYFGIPSKYQHRVLFFGILGAVLMRGAMIGLGAGLILRYQWILIFFGLFLLVTAVKMALAKGEQEPAENPLVRLARRMFRAVDFLDGQAFFTRRTVAPSYARDPATGLEVRQPPEPGTLSARWSMTPLFLALVMVEFTDLVFAVDSIPAVFAITPDPFLVFTSNLFAILGLRALYFCLAALIQRFRYLKPALVLILAFVGVKLLLLSVPPYLHVVGLSSRHPIKVPTSASMAVILGTLAAAVLLSLARPRRPGEAHGD